MSKLTSPAAILYLAITLGVAAPAIGLQHGETNTHTQANVHMWADVIALIDTDAREFAVTTVGRNRLLFTRRHSDKTTIYETRRGDSGIWSKPAPASFAVADDADPFFDPYTGTLYYMSRAEHPLKDKGADDYDIWQVELNGEEWGKAKPLENGVNTAAQEVYPTIDKDGTLYFASNRSGGYGGHDIYIAENSGTGWHAENAGPVVNSASSDSNPFIMPDGETLVFYCNKETGYGEVDLYRTNGGPGGWSTPVNLGSPINSAQGEYAPSILDAGTFIYSRGEKLVAVPMNRILR